ncbi:hypothetical protein VPH35_071059 [Triticum aestivum]|uniref:Membralin n=1 Tax=Triticum turgidum subsp. durum TaxID=4567 RepID=A0A9R0W6S6_TRITD|nr:membralin-like protein At1g60995 isoform X3 [Triticum aestivum]VAI00807.1 unnamed protein product [Triticum turgidum subsp. durum]
MDPEQTFLRVHARLSGMLSQLLTPRIRLALEYLYLAGAVALFCLLVVMHTNFVQQPGCSSEFTGIEFGEAQLVQIKIISGGLWASKGVPELKTTGEGSVHHPLSAKESIKAAVTYLSRKWYSRAALFWRNIKQVSDNALQLMVRSNWDDFLHLIKDLQLPSMDHLLSNIVKWFEKRSKSFEPTYLYGVEKGYFLLSEVAKNTHGVRTINITISARNPCFGNRWQQLLINSIVGYDTILTNSLVNSPGQGYLYNFQTKELYDLSYGHEPPTGPTRFGDYFVTKCGVLLMSLFVFFTTTMSVSFTLRETQSRMLRFTVQLQHHARHQLPTFQLIFVHVIESLVFVPIMIGILFFLFEFYDDQLLAFLVLTLVWLCELFTMISVRTSISMQFFPRFFLLYFLVFHIYFFSYTYGFSYLAFSATAAFMQHLILYFWNRFEVPALQRFIRSRAHIHQQTGVQITSSTIYTSTLHIARVNVRDPGTLNDDAGAAHEADPLLAQAEPTRNHQEGAQQLNENADAAATNPIQYEDQNLEQAGNAPAASGSLNPFGSLLLWLLGGGASDGIVSFFSMFRDVRDHHGGQDYAEPPQNENEQVT